MIVQFVECVYEASDLRDWPDCSEDCEGYPDCCPVRVQIIKDILARKINVEYTTWPDK